MNKNSFVDLYERAITKRKSRTKQFINNLYNDPIFICMLLFTNLYLVWNTSFKLLTIPAVP